MTVSLTRRERNVLAVIQQRIDETAIAPTYLEIRQAVGLRSSSGVHAAIASLQEKGWLQRQEHRARGVELLARLSEAAIAAANADLADSEPETPQQHERTES